MRAWIDVWWVDKMEVLTISAYLLALTRLDQGHGWMQLPYRQIYGCGAKSCWRGFLGQPCLKVSGGLFVPCAGGMQVVG